tara:strand:+ start:13196 stop:14110 length:915 start_codon:yes stop_codon:yes gene_type:complete
MVKPLKFLAAILLSGSNALAEPTAASDTRLHWAINDAPPFHVLHGEYQRQGICDVLTKVVHRHMPHYRPSYLQMPQPRIAQAMDNKEPVCFPCMIYKPAGEERAVYSLPTHLYYPHQIITNETTAKTLTALYGEKISLDKLLDDPRFRFGYPAGRRYGSLQPLLNEHDPYLARSGPGGAIAILNMISSGRLDYTIDYPIIASYFEQLYSRTMVTIPITENYQQAVAGAIGCANNEWGKQKIAEINQVIHKIRRDPEFIDILQLWHRDAINGNDDNYNYFNQQGLQALDEAGYPQQTERPIPVLE